MKARFTTHYDGYPAAVFSNSVEYHNFTLTLKSLKMSFLTKIRKAQKRGRKEREFIVMLVEPHGIGHGA